MIKFVNTTKIYGKKIALKSVNLDIPQGDFVFLVGPSGAGKTTIMRLIYKEDTPESGSVIVGNIDVTKLSGSCIPSLRRRMGIIFQDFKLLPNQTSFDNVAYVIRALGYSDEEIQKRVYGALKVVGLLDRLQAKPDELSAGEQQRIGIARAIVNGPPLLIADEPTGNLDPTTSLEIITLLEQINKKGTTVLISTHDQSIVNELKKRVIYLKDGEIVSDTASGQYTIH